HDQEEADDDGPQRRASDLAAEAGGDVLRAERRRPDRVGEVALQRVLLPRRQRLGADLEARVLAVHRLTAALDDGSRLADLRGLVPDRVERGRLWRPERDLGAALEVASEKRTSAVIAVTTFASTIVWNPFE